MCACPNAQVGHWFQGRPAILNDEHADAPSLTNSCGQLARLTKVAGCVFDATESAVTEKKRLRPEETVVRPLTGTWQ